MAPHLSRLHTGIPRLDYILKGGLFTGGTYAVMGPPGSGKTILANHLAYIHAGGGGRVVYVTLLVESHTKMLAHMSTLDFYRAELVPSRVFYVSGYTALRDNGLDGLLSLVRRTVREQEASMLVIDGIESVCEVAPGTQVFREWVHELQGLALLAECTTLMLTNLRDRDHVENGLVDGLFQLTDELVGPRALRQLTVHKFRGSDYLRGKHEVEITETGMVIHPRTEIQFDKPAQDATEARIRMEFGVEELDKMLGGGVPSGSATALLGAPGTGKTMLGLSFLLAGAQRGQKGYYFGFYEPPPRLIEKVAAVGLDLKPWIDKGLIELVWQPPLEHMMDALAEQLLEKLRDGGEQRRRLFVDGVEGFRAAAVYPDRIPRFLSALTNQLRTYDVTTLFAEELELFSPSIDMPNPELANVVESVILLRYVELRSQLHRLISIMKMRESAYDTSIREFHITEEGVSVDTSFSSAEQILTGIARLSSEERGAT